ncbi:MAG: hypothetical protein IJ168_00855 [Eubacterium sp.]|nr:hypothetical protein [Eubacterium sp.]
MKFDMEVEDILYTMKNKDDSASEPAGEEPPVTEVQQEQQEALAPPKPKLSETEEEPDGLVWLDGPSEETAGEGENKESVAKKIKVNFRANYLPKMKAGVKKLLKKQTLTALGAVLLVIVLVFGGVKLAQVGRTATLKKYAAQYGVEYPDGIRREFYEAYGENPSLAGKLVITDTDTDEAVYSEPENGEALFEKGSSIYEDQHFRAIALTSEQADLERVYATADGYLDASQTLTFRTLFGDEKYKVVAAFYTNTKPEDDNGYVFPYNCYGNFTEDSLFQYQDRIKTRSLYHTGHLIQPEDYCLTVSVDSDLMPDYRFVVVGVRVKHNVKKTTETTVNENIRYPQSYCDAKGIHNIYWMAGHWYPEIYTDEAMTETQQLTIDDFIE